MSEFERLRWGPSSIKSAILSKSQIGTTVNAGTRHSVGRAENHPAEPTFGLPICSNRSAANSRKISMTATFSGHARRMALSPIIWTACLALLSLTWQAKAQAPGVPTAPSITNGYGTIAATNSSVALSTVTASPNSVAWAMPVNGNIVVYNAASSAGVLYVCPLGGTCSATVGWPISPDESITFNIGGRTVSPTIFAASTATVWIGW